MRTEEVKYKVGRENGLRLVLDLHSNTISFGSLDQQHLAFNLFIGQPEQFPMMREKSIQLEPGKEHFVDLSATVVSSKSIKDIAAEARGCFFKDEGDLEFMRSTPSQTAGLSVQSSWLKMNTVAFLGTSQK